MTNLGPLKTEILVIKSAFLSIYAPFGSKIEFFRGYHPLDQLVPLVLTGFDFWTSRIYEGK